MLVLQRLTPSTLRLLLTLALTIATATGLAAQTASPGRTDGGR